MDEAERVAKWYKGLFGENYSLPMRSYLSRSARTQTRRGRGRVRILRFFLETRGSARL